MDNWRETILSQYDNSERLLALIESMNAVIEPTADIAAFYESVFDPETAFGWGLDVWGRIVAIPRTLVWLELEADNVAYFHRSDMHDGNMTAIREKPMNDLVQI